MALVLGVHDQSQQSGEASLSPDSQVVWRQLYQPLVCSHSSSPHKTTHTHACAYAIHKPIHSGQSTAEGTIITNSPICSSIWPLPLLCSITAIQQLVNRARREEQQRLKSALTFVTQKCNFATPENLITTQGQRKYFKSINELCF